MVYGVDVFVATNQSGIARGKLDLKGLSAIHNKMAKAVEAFGGKIKDIAFCPHGPEDNCDCRKPKPGLLSALASIHDLELEGRPYVGDSLKDIRAAEAVGCKPILVMTGNGAETLHIRPHHEPVFKDLMEFASSYVTIHLRN